LPRLRSQIICPRLSLMASTYIVSLMILLLLDLFMTCVNRLENLVMTIVIIHALIRRLLFNIIPTSIHICFLVLQWRILIILVCSFLRIDHIRVSLILMVVNWVWLIRWRKLLLLICLLWRITLCFNGGKLDLKIVLLRAWIVVIGAHVYIRAWISI